MSKRIRCAIYTRKSTEEGLEQDFNSLDAQREACVSFILSQKGLGWVVQKKRYDDGGISGGTMERPALQALLADIDAGKIDLVVVYKVDRLTRSLMDFAKIIDTFDARDISFVSVTQQFNTANSMGRLTLNVLLSFAQFEREVTAERIRDKIAASKKKGMWMGGLPPLGYDNVDKKLVINEEEANSVRTMFELYLDLGSVRDLKREADRLGLVTKMRTIGGRTTGGKSFSTGHLYQLLQNPLYLGEVAHKGKTYPGLHEGIVARDVWDAVQWKFETRVSPRRSPKNVKQTNLLTGLIYDEEGDPLCPTYTTNNARRYRYYISKRLVRDADQNTGWRLPAEELEGRVEREVCDLLNDQMRLLEAVQMPGASPRQIQKILSGASELAKKIGTDTPTEKIQALRGLIERVAIGFEGIHIWVSRRGFLEMVGGDSRERANDDDPPIILKIAVRMQRRRAGSKIILLPSSGGPNPDDRLIELLADTHDWFEQLANGKAATVREIAGQCNRDENDISRFMQLAFLAPDIVDAILIGKQPPELTTETLKRLKVLPRSWEKQRQILGFTP
jgi:site-specific DNA recombinase